MSDTCYALLTTVPATSAWRQAMIWLAGTSHRGCQFVVSQASPGLFCWFPELAALEHFRRTTRLDGTLCECAPDAFARVDEILEQLHPEEEDETDEDWECLPPDVIPGVNPAWDRELDEIAEELESERHWRGAEHEQYGASIGVIISQWGLAGFERRGAFEELHPYPTAQWIIYEPWPLRGERLVVPITGRRWSDLWLAAERAITKSDDRTHITVERFVDACGAGHCLVLETGC